MTAEGSPGTAAGPRLTQGLLLAAQDALGLMLGEQRIQVLRRDGGLDEAMIEHTAQRFHAFAHAHPGRQLGERLVTWKQVQDARLQQSLGGQSRRGCARSRAARRLRGRAQELGGLEPVLRYACKLLARFVEEREVVRQVRLAGARVGLICGVTIKARRQWPPDLHAAVPVGHVGQTRAEREPERDIQ